MKQELVKIRTKKGRFITLTISKQTDTQVIGKDKYGYSTIVSIEDIDYMYPIMGDHHE